MNSCKECVFLNEDMSCDLDKLDLVKEKYTYFVDDDGIHHFDGICYGSRTKSWGEKRGGDLKEAFKKETSLHPAIFLPINSWDQIKSFEKNFKYEIEAAPLINIINYSDVPDFNILARFKNDDKVKITRPLDGLQNPDLLIYQNIKLPTKQRFHHMMVIDDVTLKPLDGLYDKIYDIIYNKFDPIVCVLGDGYYFILKNLFCNLVANHHSIFEFINTNLDSKEVFKESDLNA